MKPGSFSRAFLRKMILIEPPRSQTVARRHPLNKRELARFAKLAIHLAGAAGAVSILLADDERIRELNQQFRKKNKPTDVLSFPALAFPPDAWGDGHPQKQLGDLAISLDTAGRQAETFGHSLATEVKVLILHGILHLAGHDHERDDGEMAAIEGRLRKELHLPATLIERASRTPAKPVPRRPRARPGASGHE
jgi:probable rRNA maturation factor